jgi:membrane-bound lytic murein transglycosylase D
VARTCGTEPVTLLTTGPIEICSTEPLAEPETESAETCTYEIPGPFDFGLMDPGPARPMPASLEMSSYRFNVLALKAVERNIKVFTERIKGRFARYLGRSGRYMKMMRSILKEEGLPEDLAYLPIVESGFNVRAYSRSRASGPWQFIAGTGKRYGLKVNWWVDERRDPVKSTRAAARYLRDLHEMFDSWSLALAAYNAGENRVKKALRRARKKDIWGLIKSRHLRMETRNYVPKFIAATLIASNPGEFGFDNVHYQEDLAYDEAVIKGPLTIDIIARCAGTTNSVIKELNPELRRWSTPPYAKKYTVRIPRGAKEKFFEKLAKIPPGKRLGLRAYRVRRGDTVSAIARKTGVSSRVIIAYNKLGRRALIRPGQKLLLPVPAGYSSGPLPKNLPKVTLPGGVTAREYRVRRGDTVSAIARKAGVSVREIIRLNKMRNKSFIKAGQRLLLPAAKKN